MGARPVRWSWTVVGASLALACGSSRSGDDDDGSAADDGPNTEVAAGDCGGFTACAGNLLGRWRYAWRCEDPKLVMGTRFRVSDENGYDNPANHCVAGNQLLHGFDSSAAYEVLER